MTSHVNATVRPIVEAMGLTVRYGKREAVSGVNLPLHRGALALLGPNGAGKSSLMSVLSLLRRPSHGALRVHDLQVWGVGATPAQREQARRLVGFLPQKFELMEWSTVQDNVRFAGWARGLDAEALPDAVDRALSQVDLTDRSGERARSLSGGMRQRLGVACAIVHRPAVLLLDEPTAALDPTQRQHVRDTVKEIARDAAVVFSTHIVEDVVGVSDTVAVMTAGKITFQGTRREFLSAGQPTETVSTAESAYQKWAAS